MIIITLFNKDKKDKPKKIISIDKKAKPQNMEEALLKKIEDRLRKLEEAINKLDKSPLKYQFNVDKLEMHNPQLKELTFRLDSLDIKELSGALNMGNNFGVRVNKEKPYKNDKKSFTKDNPMDVQKEENRSDT